MCIIVMAHAQTENSPYSRYGLGDIVPGQNTLNRGMGGLSAAYSDIHSINFVNPASYARLKFTTFSMALDLDNETIRSDDPPDKFTSYSPMISYMQLAFPVSKKKNWGVNLGLRPMNRIGYKIEKRERLPDIDSVQTLFEGHGGSYEVYAGTGMGTRNLSIGFNFGYRFGNKDFSTKQIFLPDSPGVSYYNANYETKSSFGGFFLSGGLQYIAHLGKASKLHLGAYGTLRQNLSASRNVLRETFNYDPVSGAVDSIDVVEQKNGESGRVLIPSSFGAGLIYEKTGKWMLGADLSGAGWSRYRYFGVGDRVQDSWNLRVGGQLLPSGGQNYWRNVSYRGGFYYGRDYINAGGDMNDWGVSIGLGLPMRRAAYTNQLSIINTSIEFGQRGNKQNLVRENYLRISVGLSLSDIWFQKHKYH